MQLELYLQDFLLLASAHFLALISPGVDFFIIIDTNTRYGKISASLTAFGISMGNLFYIILAFLGIVFIQNNIYLFNLLKFFGSLYLFYISYSLIQAQNRELFKIEKRKTLKSNYIKDFIRGFLSAILNPKNSIFYFTIFSITIKEYTPFSIQIFYIFWMFSIVLIWDLFIIYLLEKKKIKSFLNKNISFIEKISAVFLSFIAFYIIYTLFI